MEPVEAVGRTVEEAVESGLSTLGLARSQVEIEVIDEGSKGLFGLVGRRHARVVVRPLANIESKGEVYEGAMGAVESPVRAEEDLGGIDEDVDEWRDGSSFDEDDAKSSGYVFLEELISLMGVDVDITETRSEDITLLEVEGRSLGMLIGRRGETLDAIQYLVNLAANREARASGSSERERYVVDIGRYRKRREEVLENKALELAERVVQEQRDEVMEPMSALERRVVHMALRDYDGVVTHSEGREPYRRIVISPKE